MEVNFLNQKPCIPSWPGVFQFDIILSVVMSKSVCISAFRPTSNPSISLVILFIHSAFLLRFFWLPYFCPKSFGFFCIRLLVYFYCYLLPIVNRIFFRCFGIIIIIIIIIIITDRSVFICVIPPRYPFCLIQRLSLFYYIIPHITFCCSLLLLNNTMLDIVKISVHLQWLVDSNLFSLIITFMHLYDRLNQVK